MTASVSNEFPKTLFFEVAHRFGGSGTRLINLMKTLPKDRVGLACLSGSETAKALQPLGYPIYEIGKNKFDPRIPFRVAKLLRQEGFEIFDTQNIQSKIWGSLAILMAQAAFVSTVNSEYMHEYGDNLKGKVYHRLDLWTNSYLDRIIAVSVDVAQMLVGAGVHQSLISTIRNAITLDAATVDRDPAWLQNRFSLPEDSVVGVAVGRLEWVKGFDVLISAVEQVVEACPDFYCLIVGKGPLRGELEAAASASKASDHIVFAGFQSLTDVYQIIKSGDMFLMPSRSEGTPMALLEAATLGCPIIASNVGGIPDVVSDGAEALLVPPETADQLAAAVVRLCRDSSLRERLGATAKNKVKMRFSPIKQRDAVQQAYALALEHFARSKKENKRPT